MPVAFFIDTAIAEYPALKNLKEITLSYTFFPSRKAGGQKSADLTRTTR